MPTLTCPNRDELLAYAAGRLADEISEEIAAHLDSCPDCQAGLATLDDAEDTFVAQFRQPPATDPYLEESQCRVAVARARAAMETTGETPAMASGRSVRGTILGEYELIEELGHGGMGTVYKALHTKLDRVVALKVLTTGRTQDPRAISPLRTRDEGHRQAGPSPHRPRLRRPGDRRHAGARDGIHRRARPGGDCPPLTYAPRDAVHHAERDEYGTPAVRRRCRWPMPARWPAGGDWAAICPPARPRTPRHQALEPDVDCSPLSLLGEGPGEGGMDRRSSTWDSPVFTWNRRRSKRAGPSRTMCGEITGTDQAMGTADYMAPEQVSNSRSADIRADIYSLGCTLYKLLAGRAPFEMPAPRPAEKMAAHAGEERPCNMPGQSAGVGVAGCGAGPHVGQVAVGPIRQPGGGGRGRPRTRKVPIWRAFCRGR